MEINIKEIMNKVKSTAQQVGTKASELGKSVMSSTKTNLRIMELKTQIEADYKAAGKLLYAVHSGEEIDPDAIEELMNGIDGKSGEITALRDSLAKAKESRQAPAELKTCPACGKPVSADSAYCPTCGAKLEFAEAVEEIKEKAEEIAEEVGEKLEDVKEDAEEKVEEIKDAAAKKFDESKSAFDEIVDDMIREKSE